MLLYIRICALLLILSVGGLVQAQETEVFTEAQKHYKDGVSFYKKGLYNQAYKAFKKTVKKAENLVEPQAPTLLSRAELGLARCAIRLERPEGEVLALNFIRTYSPDPIADEALVEVGSYYFNARNYKKAIEFFEKAPLNSLPKKERSEIQFKTGYSYFVQKEFEKAKQNFIPIKDIENQYFYPTNYYLGLCYFFDGDYEAALPHFRTVESSGKYDDYIPYYAAQIMFAQRRYQDLIEYVEPRLEVNRGLKNKKELNQLLGQSYFELGEYEKALPFLESYAERSATLREEEFYQVAFTQYQTGNYRKAIKNFEELYNVEDELGQNAMYYLADCYLKAGDKTSAWTAMGKASRLNFDPQLQQDALFNYGKLSYELQAYNEASKALQELPPTSPYYTEGQQLLGKIFLNYRDYESALNLIQQIPNPTPELQATYQKVLLYRGIQLLRDDQRIEAKNYFQQAANLPYDPATRVQGNFWLGDIAYQEGNYDLSIRYLNQFLQTAPGMRNLPPESSVMAANYLLGYDYLKKQDYASSGRYFSEAVRGIQANRRFLGESKLVSLVLGDAVIRAGDSYFKRNQYNDAVAYYNEAISRKYNGYIYALYQKALIEGLNGRTTEKILALERLAQNYPRSEWADDALFQLGSTYQEIQRFQQAIPPLQQLTTQYKTSSNLVNQGLIKLGLISYNMGDVQRSINYYKQVVSNNPTPDESSLALAALQEIYIEDLARPDEYLAFLQSVGQDVGTIARDSVTFQSAEIQYQNGSFDRAIPGYSNYLQQFPNGRHRLEAYYKRGECYSVLGQWNQALADYEAVVNTGPSQYYQESLNKAALIAYNYAQDFPKSLGLYTQLEQSVLSEDQKFEAQLGALRSAYRIPDPNAVRTWAARVANNPGATDQQAANAQFYLGKLAYDQNDFFTALQAFNEVIAKSDNEQTAEARYLIASIYYQQGQLDQAQELCINANRESSAYPYWVAKSVLLLSDIFARKNDLLNARAALEALLENYSGDQQIIQEANAKLQAINRQIEQGSRLDQGIVPQEFMDNSGGGGQ